MFRYGKSLGRNRVILVVRRLKSTMKSKPKRTQIPFEGGSGRTPTGAMHLQTTGLVSSFAAMIPVRCLAIRQLQQHCADMKNPEVRSALSVLDTYASIIVNDVIVSSDELDES